MRKLDKRLTAVTVCAVVIMVVILSHLTTFKPSDFDPVTKCWNNFKDNDLYVRLDVVQRIENNTAYVWDKEV